MKINAYIFVYGISGLLQWLVVWQNTITKESCITIEGNCDNWRSQQDPYKFGKDNYILCEFFFV